MPGGMGRGARGLGIYGERKEGFGRIRVEQRFHSMKGNIGGGSWVLSG